ncbi:MAG: flagellar hook-basal body complex protein [Lachnobacterium sp.]|nr:flagellar hook-basal body complex protein [Lachnobacterium sp.]
MMRALYSAVSGLKTHQTKMDVIGNNIANVNTEAFKASSVRFSEIMYQTTSSASSGNGAAGTGGKNAKQIGLGVTTGTTTVSITASGSAETTGNPFDLKLTDKNSTNFFVVSDGTSTFFTRAGDFYVDGNGYLCMSSTGYTLQGWQVDANGNVIVDSVSPLQVMSPQNQTSAPESTTLAYVSGIIDKNDANANDNAVGRTITLGLFDDLGYKYTAKFNITKNAADGEYTVKLTDILSSGTSKTAKSIFELDADGNFVTTDANGNTGDVVYNGRAYKLDDLFNAATLKFDETDGTFNYIRNANTAAADAATNKEVTLNLGLLRTEDTVNAAAPESNFSNITMNWSSARNYNNSGTSTIAATNGNIQGLGTGKALGALTGISINDDGTIYGSYDNGNNVCLGQIAVAQFANASGLEKVGENCYQTTLNSGEFDGVGVAIDADGSSMESGVLEMSNVDLSGQFTDMIITQRGFQANSRVITTSDTLLEELINLKR